MSKDLPEQYKKSITGYPQCWVQLCPLKAPNTSRESGSRIRAAALLPVLGGVRSQLGSSRWTKWHFHRHLQKQSLYCSLFRLRLSRCSRCVLITKRSPEGGWRSWLLCRQAKSWCRQLEDFCDTACCRHAAIFN